MRKVRGIMLSEFGTVKTRILPLNSGSETALDGKEIYIPVFENGQDVPHGLLVVLHVQLKSLIFAAMIIKHKFK